MSDKSEEPSEKDPKFVRAGRRSRRKGRKWEWEIIHRLREVFGPHLYRGQQGILGGAAPGEGCDVEGTPFFIEAKHEQMFNWRTALQQAEEKSAEKKDARPILVVGKEDKKPPGWRIGKHATPPIIVMKYSDFLILLEELVELRKLRDIK